MQLGKTGVASYVVSRVEWVLDEEVGQVGRTVRL